MEEFAEFAAVGGECLQRLEAVDHNQPGAASSDHAAELLSNTAEPALVDGRPEIFVEDRCPDRGGVEERQALAKPGDLLQRLGDGGEVDRGPFGPRVPEGVLLGQDRLAGAGAPHDEADGIRGQAAAQDLIERCMPARQPVTHARPPARD